MLCANHQGKRPEGSNCQQADRWLNDCFPHTGTKLFEEMSNDADKEMLECGQLHLITPHS